MKTSLLKKLALTAALCAGALGIPTAQATSTTFTGSYTQNFDLALTNSSTTMPPGFACLQIAGGHSDYTAANPITATAVASAASESSTLLIFNAGTAIGSNKSGTQLWNIGCWDGTTTDKALGSDPTGVAGMVIDLSMTNNTGSTLYGVTFQYSCKMITNGAGSLSGLVGGKRASGI